MTQSLYPPVRYPYPAPGEGETPLEKNGVVMFVHGGTPSILRVRLDGLDRNGRHLYSTLRQQSLDMNHSLVPLLGWFHVCISDPAKEAPTLFLQVKTQSPKDGIRLWRPRIIDIASSGDANPMPHTAVFNFIAQALEQHLASGGLNVWMNPAWITKTEASAIVSPAGGNPVSRIANLANTGKLATWDNPTAKFRPGRSMVYRPQIVALLEKLTAVKPKPATRKKTP